MMKSCRKIICTLLLSAPLLMVGCMMDSSDEHITQGGSNVEVQVPSNDEVDASIFTMLNLDYPGLEQVKTMYEQEQYYYAAEALLRYMRERTDVSDPEINLMSPSISDEELQIATWALSTSDYRFYVEGFSDPAADGAPYTCKKDKLIDWTLCQSGDEEQLYGLHRHAWYEPQGLAYRTTLNEQYVKDFVTVHSDWSAKHSPKAQNLDEGAESPAPAIDSNDYAWRLSELSERVNSYGPTFIYMMQSVNFTPQFAALFLGDVAQQAQLLYTELSAQEDKSSDEYKAKVNSLMRIAALFPELEGAASWRGFAVDVLNQGIDPEWFSALNMDYAPLSGVKRAYESGNYYEAAKGVVEYLSSRGWFGNPSVPNADPTITASEQRWADYALLENGYRFYVKNYFEDKDAQIPYSYLTEEGTIDWQNMPTTDYEHRYQLQRHQWMLGQAKAYAVSGNENYVEQWMTVFMDWFRQNPQPDVDLDYTLFPGNQAPEYVNAGWTWRPLDVAARLIDHCAVIEYVRSSKSLTPAFVLEFYSRIAQQADHIVANYSSDSNHLITQAQAVTFAGSLFPELKGAASWVISGSERLNDCVESQYWADGWLRDGDFSYHISSIEDFRLAMLVAQNTGNESYFPAEYVASLKKMTEVVKQMVFPDYSSVNMADTRKASWSKSVLKRNFGRYAELFPEDKELLWMATEGAEGTAPTNKFAQFADCGYYTVRSGWSANDMMMVVGNATQSPSEQWHRQWDNGTFELYIKGRQFFPDSGCYTYNSGSDRTRYATTNAHNTLTLDGKRITACRGELLRLDDNKGTSRLVIKNPSYDGLTHRRSVFCVDGLYYVVVDEAYGDATGEVNLNFHLAEGSDTEVLYDSERMGAYTAFADGNNLAVRTFSDQSQMTYAEREGFVSYNTNVEAKRKSYSVSVQKSSAEPVRFVTVLYPASNADAVNIDASFSGAWSESRVAVNITINGGEPRSLVNSNLTK